MLGVAETARGPVTTGAGTGDRKQGIAAAGDLLGAIAASSCCVVPLVLFSPGVSRVWIGNLVTLAVDNLFCATCPYIVKQVLTGVPGVRDVEVSYETKTAVVTFEDSETDIAALTEATGSVGFPSRLIEQGG
jgi:mercuric ion binding protein